MKVVKEIVCLGGGVGGGVCWAINLSCFAGWGVGLLGLEVTFFPMLYSQQCL